MSVFGVILVRIFPHLDWIRRDSEYLFVFSPNAEKCGPEKLRIRTLFTQWYSKISEKIIKPCSVWMKLFTVRNAKITSYYYLAKMLMCYGLSLHKKWSFPLRISSVNMTKSTGDCGFGHIYWRNPSWKLHFLCSVSSTHYTPVLQGLFPDIGFFNVLRKRLPDF